MLVREMNTRVLKGIKRDILNDGSAYSALNKRITDLSEDIETLLGKQCQLSSKVEMLKCQLPHRDQVLKKAVYCIERQEKLNRQL